MVCDIYECSTIKEKFSQDIEVMLKKKDYKEVIFWIIKLLSIWQLLWNKNQFFYINVMYVL